MSNSPRTLARLLLNASKAAKGKPVTVDGVEAVAVFGARGSVHLGLSSEGKAGAPAIARLARHFGELIGAAIAVETDKDEDFNEGLCTFARFQIGTLSRG